VFSHFCDLAGEARDASPPLRKRGGTQLSEKFSGINSMPEFWRWGVCPIIVGSSDLAKSKLGKK